MPGWGDFFVEEEVGECGAVSESQVVDDASSAMLIVFLLFIFPRLRAQLLALHLRGGVPRGAFADGLAVCAEEVPLGRLDFWTVPTS